MCFRDEDNAVVVAVPIFTMWLSACDDNAVGEPPTSTPPPTPPALLLLLRCKLNVLTELAESSMTPDSKTCEYIILLSGVDGVMELCLQRL